MTVSREIFFAEVLGPSAAGEYSVLLLLGDFSFAAFAQSALARLQGSRPMRGLELATSGWTLEEALRQRLRDAGSPSLPITNKILQVGLDAARACEVCTRLRRSFTRSDA